MYPCFLNAAEAKHKSVLVTQLTLFWELKLLVIPHYLFIQNAQAKYFIHEDESVKTKAAVERFCYGYLHKTDPHSLNITCVTVYTFVHQFLEAVCNPENA